LLLDDYGLLKERRDCAMYAYDSSGNPIPPECWASACERTNLRYAKPANKKRRKNHTYIVSLPQEDRLKTTKEDFMETAQRMAKEFFVGYEVLIAIHFDDGKNPHMHLVINSIRAEDRSEAPWMMRTKEGDILPCEVVAGGMHTKKYARELQRPLMRSRSTRIWSSRAWAL